MSLLREALRAGHAPTAPPRAAAAQVLVVGGGGPLGSALLEQLLGTRHYAQVGVLVEQPVQPALRGLLAVPWQAEPSGGFGQTALVVFDRERKSNGREQAFFRPQSEHLPELAAWLQRSGVRHLLVVMPHTQSTLPEALKRGLASLDEQAVTQLGFEHLVFMRSAQAPSAQRSAGAAERVAQWMLSQLHLMVPPRDRPVRAIKVAQFAVAIAAQLPAAAGGARVVPPEWVWEAAQTPDVDTLAARWLSGQPLPETQPRRERM